MSTIIMSVATTDSLNHEILHNEEFEEILSNEDVEVSLGEDKNAFSVRADYEQFADIFIKLNQYCLGLPTGASVCWHKA